MSGMIQSFGIVSSVPHALCLQLCFELPVAKCRTALREGAVRSHWQEQD